MKVGDEEDLVLAEEGCVHEKTRVDPEASSSVLIDFFNFSWIFNISFGAYCIDLENAVA